MTSQEDTECGSGESVQSLQIINAVWCNRGMITLCAGNFERNFMKTKQHFGMKISVGFQRQGAALVPIVTTAQQASIHKLAVLKLRKCLYQIRADRKHKCTEPVGEVRFYF